MSSTPSSGAFFGWIFAHIFAAAFFIVGVGDGAWGLVGVGVFISLVSLAMQGVNQYAKFNGPFRRTPPISRPERTVAYLTSLYYAECGCLYGAWIGQRHQRPDGDVEEEHEYWVREDAGAKWKYVRYVEQLKRCEHCGRHRWERGEYSDVKSCFNDLTEKKVWKDKEQPTEIEGSDDIIPADVAHEVKHGR